MDLDRRRPSFLAARVERCLKLCTESYRAEVDIVNPNRAGAPGFDWPQGVREFEVISDKDDLQWVLNPGAPAPDDWLETGSLSGYF